LLYVEFVLSVPLMMTIFGVIWLRWREPGLPRPFRVPWYPLPPLLFLGMAIWFDVALLERQTEESLMGVGTLLLGAVVYWLTARWGRKERVPPGRKT
jgi:APA family basic amino acid/polyamine antiporter